MTSEAFGNQSEIISDLPSDDSEEGVWMLKSYAAVKLGKTERTIETWLKEGIIQGRMKDGRREVFVRNSKLTPEVRPEAPKLNHYASEPSLMGFGMNAEVTPTVHPKPSEVPSETRSEGGSEMLLAFNRMMDLSDRVLKQSEMIEKSHAELMEAQKALNNIQVDLESKKGELTRMNFEREAYNTKLVKANDTDRELQHARGELEVLRRENAELKSQLEKKKGKFLGIFG